MLKEIENATGGVERNRLKTFQEKSKKDDMTIEQQAFKLKYYRKAAQKMEEVSDRQAKTIQNSEKALLQNQSNFWKTLKSFSN